MLTTATQLNCGLGFARHLSYRPFTSPNHSMYLSKTVLMTAAILGLAACAQTPEQKANNLIDGKAIGVSGYSECMKRVEKNDARIAQCVYARLAAQGYTDRIDCIIEYKEPTCANQLRYNAEVDASNACNEELNTATWPTAIDCMDLLNK